MTTATKTLPNYTDPAQDGTGYPFAIDATLKVFDRIAGPFAVHEQETPDMTVAVDAGAIPAVGGLSIEVAATSTGAISAPAANPRNDIVHVDVADGSVGVATGVEAETPDDPSVPAGKTAVARLSLTVGMAAITDDVIDDLRVLTVMGLAAGAFLPLASQAEAEAGTVADKAMTPQRVAQAIAALAAGEDQVARDMAVVALVEANAAGVAGTKGRLVLTNPFTSDTLTTTNGTYDADGDFYDNRGALSSDLIPTMTSNTTPSGVASESSAQAGAAWNAFDGDFSNVSNSGMYTNSFPAWLQYQFATAQVVNAYTITPNGTYRWPTDWAFQGSNDGSSWTTLHSVTGESTSGWTEKRTYEFSSSTAYTHYRLYVTSGTDGTYLMINEVEMLSRGTAQNATFAVAGGSGGMEAADPSDLSAYFLFSFPDADVTVGSDVTGDLSIDGGTTQATGSWTKIGDYDAGELWRLDADVSAQTGDNPHWEINTHNNKAVELHACGGILPIYAA